MRGSHAPYPTHALRKASVRPWKVEVDDDGCILQVDPFAEQVGADEQLNGLGAWRRADAARARRES